MRTTQRRQRQGKPHYQQTSLGIEEMKQAQLNEYLLMRYASARPRSDRVSTPLKVVARYKSARVKGEIIRADALQFLRSLESDSTALVFLDPPFNLGKRYSTLALNHDALPEARYWRWMTDVLAESARVLQRGGVLYLYHLPRWAMRLGHTLEQFLDFRQWIAVSMKNGFAPSNRLYPAHYALLCFSKGRPLSFTRPKLKPATCRHCGGLVKDYGGYLHIINRQGINLSDVWEDLSPVRHTKVKLREANQLPRVLFDRVMTMSGVRGGLYVDPFAGTGTGILAAIDNGMHFAAGDLEDSNCRLLCNRLSTLAGANLVEKRK